MLGDKAQGKMQLGVTMNEKRAAAQIPDIAGRLKRVFGGKVISDKAMRAVLDESRGAY